MSFNPCTCAACGIVFGISPSYEAILRKSGKDFWCPNGHTLSFGESEVDRLRRERDRLKQDAARLVDEAHEKQQQLNTERRRAAAARGQVTGSTAAQPMVFLLTVDEGVLFDPEGKFHGWIMHRHPDGIWISVRKLEAIDPEDHPLIRALSVNPQSGENE